MTWKDGIKALIREAEGLPACPSSIENDAFEKLPSLSRARSSMCGEMSAATIPRLTDNASSGEGRYPCPGRHLQDDLSGSQPRDFEEFRDELSGVLPNTVVIRAAEVAGKWSRSSTTFLQSYMAASRD